MQVIEMLSKYSPCSQTSYMLQMVTPPAFEQEQINTGLEVTCKNPGAEELVIPWQLQLSHQTFNGEDCPLIHITVQHPESSFRIKPWYLATPI